jgi:hypothetical protein
MKIKTKKKYSIQKHITKNKKKTKTKKFKQNSYSIHTYIHTNSKKHYDVNKIVHQIELDILFTTITTQILFLIHIKTPKSKIRKQTITLLKEIRNNNKLITNTITDDELNLIFERIYKYAIMLNKEIKQSQKYKNTQTSTHIKDKQISKQTTTTSTQTNKTRGGFFFKDLEDKGDQPITGNDVVKFLDEIDSFVYNAQWTSEGEFLRNPYTLFNILRGNVDAFKSYVTWHVLPKYYQMYPPFIKWSGIQEIIDTKWEDLPDYLLAYKTYNRLQNEYLVSKGLKDPSEVKGDDNFFTKMANKLDTSIQQFQQVRRKYQGIKSGNFTLQVPL